MTKLSITFVALILPLLAFGQGTSSLDFVSGLSYSYRILSVGDVSNVQTIKTVRDHIEKPKVNWRFGANYSRTGSGNIGFKIGLRLMSVGYVLNTATPQWGYLPDVMSVSVPDADNKVVEDYKFIEIPLVFKYQLSRKRFSPFIELGAAPSIYLKSRRLVKLDGNKDIEYHREAVDGFNKFHIVGVFGIGSDYILKNGDRIFLQPTFRYHFTELVDGPLSENLFNVGVEAGYRLMINKNKREL